MENFRPHPGPLPQEREPAGRALGSSNVSVVIAARHQFGEERTSTRDIRLAQTRRTLLPLLGGEGRGEGQRNSNFKAIPANRHPYEKPIA